MAVPLLPSTVEALAERVPEPVRVERIDLYPVRYPTHGYFKFLADPRGRRGRAAIVIRLSCSDGTVGWGQSVPNYLWSYETFETALIVLRNYLGPALVGQDVRRAAAVYARLQQALAPGFSTGMPIARAGLEIALHDIWGKLLGKSVAELWGRRAEEPVLLSWTVNPKRLDQTEQLVEQGRRLGYRHFNIKIGPDVRADLELARRVRQAAPDAFLWADANGAYDPPTAVRAAKALADVGVDVLEAPLRPNQIRGYQKLKRLGALPILMDEGVVSPVELAEFIALGMLDGIALKLSRCGGFRSARGQIQLIEKHGLLWLGSGLTDPDISLAATVQLYSAYRLRRPAALNGPQFLAADVLRTPLSPREGRILPPQGPGLGIEVDEAKLRELVARTPVEWPEPGVQTLRAGQLR